MAVHSEDRDVYLVFDKGSSIPFYVREGIGLGVVFHNLENCFTEPTARKEVERLGFDKKMKLVQISQ